jgi:KTSC domain
MTMNLVQVKSTRIVAIGYDEQTRTMRVLFPEDKLYEYVNVAASVHGALMKSESKGSFFQEHIVGKFKYRKVDPNSIEGKVNTMAKKRVATAKKSDTVQPAVEQPKADVKPAAAVTTATPAQPVASKQDMVIAKLKEGWTAKGVNLDKLTIKDDGKFKLLVVDQGWPTVRLGSTGGITVVELKSYASAFDAAMDGLNLFQKQQAREAKKATTASAPPAPPVKAEAKTAA